MDAVAGQLCHGDRRQRAGGLGPDKDAEAGTPAGYGVAAQIPCIIQALQGQASNKFHGRSLLWYKFRLVQYSINPRRGKGPPSASKQVQYQSHNQQRHCNHGDSTEQFLPSGALAMGLEQAQTDKENHRQQPEAHNIAVSLLYQVQHRHHSRKDRQQKTMY